MTRRIEIDIDGDASGFKRAAGDSVDAGNKLDKGLRNSAVGGAVAGVAMAGVNQALDFVTGALSGASEAAKEDTASSDRLALSLKNTGREQALTTEQIEAAISANQAKGVSDSAQRDGISDFLDLTKSATDAMKLNNATVELAAAKGIEYSAAEAMIRSAAAGKTAALQKAGVAVEKGASAVEIATAVEKKFGGSLDSVAQTQSGKSKIASEKMGEAMEKVGKVINKIAEVVMPAVADAMTFVIDNVFPPLGKGFEVVSAIVGAFIRVIGRLVEVFRGIAGVVKGVWDGVTTTIRNAVNSVIDIINGAIRGINAIQVHIHVGPVGYDFDGLNLSQIPRLHTGGVVPGVPGSDVLSVLQAGERVTAVGSPAGGGNSYSIVVQSLDPTTAATLVIRAIDEFEQANGRRFARATA
jgi:hypothetical protein